MAKSLTLPYGGKMYILAFTRKTVMEMEREGFRFNELGNEPMTQITLLVHGAFKANCRMVSDEMIDEIYAHISDKSGFLQKLTEMYEEPLATLSDEPPEGDEGNVNWTANW